MSEMIKCQFISVLILLLIIKYNIAIYINYSKTSSEVFGEYIINKFGLARGGLTSVNYTINSTSISLSNDQSDLLVRNSYVVLLVLNSIEVDNGWYDSLNSNVNTNNIGSLCQQPSLYRKQITSSGSFNIPIQLNHNDVSQYSLVILQCYNPPSSYSDAENSIQISVTASMTNPQPYSNNYSHLPIDEVAYTRILEGEIIIFSLFIGAILLQCIISKHWVKSIYWLFLATLVTQLLFTIALYVDYSHYNQYGYESNALLYFDNITSHFNSVTLLLTLFLVSLGWSIIRRFLSEKEWRMLSFTIAFYFIIGLGNAVCLDQNSTSCASLNLVTYILRTLVFLAIIVAMNFTVTQLKAMVIQSPWTPSIQIQYIQTRQYMFFRIAFIVYILAPTIIYLVQSSLFSWKESWVPTVLNDLILILMYFQMGVNFSPIHEDLVLGAFDGTYDTHVD